MSVFKRVVESLNPSWGAVVMGTGILAVCFKLYSQNHPILASASRVVACMNTLVFAIILVPWVLRWFIAFDKVVADLNDPIKSSFYPTLPIGALVLASDYLVVLGVVKPALYLWVFGATLTLALGVVAPYNMFKCGKVCICKVNPAWFIPPVGLIVIPIPGGLLLQHLTGVARDAVLTIDIIGWGSGFFTYLPLLAICMYRFIMHDVMPGTLAPTVWINLGPIGAGTISLYNIVLNAGYTSFARPAIIDLGTLFWGSGAWWLAIAVVMTIYYARRLKLPYAMSWWAFTFPLGAYAASTHAVSIVTGSRVIYWYGASLTTLLLALWLTTASRTLVNVLKQLSSQT